MASLVTIVKGWAGKPTHPPLTDASIGAYTVGVAMLVLAGEGAPRAPARALLLGVKATLLLDGLGINPSWGP